MTTETITPQAKKSSRHKIFPILAVLIISLVASLFVRMLIKDRITYAERASSSIKNRWGGDSVLFAPALILGDIPSSSAPEGSADDILVIQPDTLQTHMTFNPEKRSYGIFSTVVYTATITTEGTFAYALSTTPDISHFVVPAKVGSTDQIHVTDLSLGNKKVNTRSSYKTLTQPNFGWVGDSAPRVIEYPVALSKDAQSLSFSYTTTVKGSQKFSFDAHNTNAAIDAEGVWGDIGFSGKLLPDTRSIDKENFKSNWIATGDAGADPIDYITYTSYIYNQITKENNIDIDTEVSDTNESEYTLEINFLGKSDTYVKTDRSTKYAILFISLTFLILFLFEILKDARIHPMQYFFIGAGLAIFYLLLLAFSEHVGFFIAYLIASIAIITVSTWYTRTFLKEKKNAWLVTGLLTFLYAFMYFLLQLRDYTLLAGTLFVFIVLIVTMYTTRKVDWYSMLGGGKAE